MARLPVPLEVIDKRTIGASLGQDSLQRSLRAGLIGLVAVCIFMLVLYRLPGALGCGCLAGLHPLQLNHF